MKPSRGRSVAAFRYAKTNEAARSKANDIRLFLCASLSANSPVMTIIRPKPSSYTLHEDNARQPVHPQAPCPRWLCKAD